MADNNLPILSMQTVDLSLEDIFIEVTENERQIASDIDERDIEFVNVKKEEMSDESDI